MGARDRERKQRILSDEEVAFKRASLTRRLHQVLDDWCTEYPHNTDIYAYVLSHLSQKWKPRGTDGC